MSRTIDANVLLFASDRDSPRQARAQAFLDDLTAGGACSTSSGRRSWHTLRIATHAAIFRAPLDPLVATTTIGRLLALPHVRTIGEGVIFWDSLRDVVLESDARDNLVPDAHLVALMIENGARTIWTRDRDFRRFPGIVVRDPLGEPAPMTR